MLSYVMLCKNYFIYSSAEEKNHRPAAVLWCPSLCCAYADCRSRFHSTRRKVRRHVTWCLAKTSYPLPDIKVRTDVDVAVTNSHCIVQILYPFSNSVTVSNKELFATYLFICMTLLLLFIDSNTGVQCKNEQVFCRKM